MGLLACATMPDFQALHFNKRARIQLSSDFPNVFAWINIYIKYIYAQIYKSKKYIHKSLVFWFHILHAVCSSLMRACGEKGNGKRRISILGGLAWPYPDFPFGWMQCSQHVLTHLFCTFCALLCPLLALLLAMSLFLFFLKFSLLQNLYRYTNGVIFSRLIYIWGLCCKS